MAKSGAFLARDACSICPSVTEKGKRIIGRPHDGIQIADISRDLVVDKQALGYFDAGRESDAKKQLFPDNTVAKSGSFLARDACSICPCEQSSQSY